MNEARLFAKMPISFDVSARLVRTVALLPDRLPLGSLGHRGPHQEGDQRPGSDILSIT